MSVDFNVKLEKHCLKLMTH